MTKTLKSARKYKVHVGYNATGKGRWRYFSTTADACRFVSKVFRQRNVVLSIENI